MIFRVGLLLTISWLIGLSDPVLTLDWFNDPQNPGNALALSWKDIILLCGGLFLIVKSTMEIHHKMQGDEHEESNTSKSLCGDYNGHRADYFSGYGVLAGLYPYSGGTC